MDFIKLFIHFDFFRHTLGDHSIATEKNSDFIILMISRLMGKYHISTLNLIHGGA